MPCYWDQKNGSICFADLYYDDTGRINYPDLYDGTQRFLTKRDYDRLFTTHLATQRLSSASQVTYPEDYKPPPPVWGGDSSELMHKMFEFVANLEAMPEKPEVWRVESEHHIFMFYAEIIERRLAGICEEMRASGRNEEMFKGSDGSEGPWARKIAARKAAVGAKLSRKGLIQRLKLTIYHLLALTLVLFIERMVYGNIKLELRDFFWWGFVEPLIASIIAAFLMRLPELQFYRELKLELCAMCRPEAPPRVYATEGIRR